MKFSIITVNLNNKLGLQKTLDSVICQTWKGYEWIVIDGGSTDGSKELIEQYQQYFAYWCSEPDKGIYNAMNKGVSHAINDYLLFLNSGDCLHNEDVLAKINSLNTDVDVLTGISVSQETGKPMKVLHSDILRQLFYDSLNHQATFIKRSLFERHKYNEDNKIVSDWEFFIQTILIDGSTFEYSDIVVADFDISGISNQPKWNELQKLERKQIIDKYFSPYIQKDLSHYFEICSSTYYKNIRFLYDNSKTLSSIFRKINSFFYRMIHILGYV